MDKAKVAKIKVWQVGLVKPIYTYKVGAGTVQSFTQTLTGWKWEVLSFSASGIDIKMFGNEGRTECVWIPSANISYVIYDPNDAAG